LEDYKEDEPQILNKVVAILTAIYSGQEEIAQELFNEVDKDELYSSLVIEYPFEIVATWTCEECKFTWEALLLGENNRFIGQIWDSDTSKVLWSNNLPKERDKAIIMLELELVKRSDLHKNRTHVTKKKDK